MKYWLTGILLLSIMGTTLPVLADVRALGGGNNASKLRVRVGDNALSGINTVKFEVPGLQLGNGTPVVSTNRIAGASGVYTVRVVLDNRRLPAGTASLYADSSADMSCTTASSCGTTSIPFTAISWHLRDGDNMELANSFDGTSNQLMHQQAVGLVTNPDLSHKGWRYRDYVQFQYSNDLFLPAGTYRGEVVFNGSFPD